MSKNLDKMKLLCYDVIKLFSRKGLHKMQNKKQNRNHTKNHGNKKRVRFEELLADDRFDDEDADSVTEDTLEFLSLDDDMIASYQKSHSAKPAKKSRSAKSSGSSRSAKVSRMSVTKKSEKASRLRRDYDEYEEEAYYEEDYEDESYYEDEEDYENEAYYEDEEDYGDDSYEDEEDYGDDSYEDEDDYGDDSYDEEDYEDESYYEDEDYEDEDYDDYDDDDGVLARFRDFLSDMSALDMVVAMLGILVVAGAIVTGGLYLNAKSMQKQVATFAEVGGEIEGVSVIGESGLLAVSESAKVGSMLDYEEEDWEEGQEPEEKEDPNKEIEVELRLTSIQSDLKIKFANKSTGKLVGGVPFEVEVSGGGKTYDLKDDDKDGIIYQTGISAGSYSVKMKSLDGEAYQKYKLQSSASTVEVTDKIAYKKVDVADEVKTEAEINVAKEDTAQQNTVVESALTDTVEWVESTKTPVGGEKDSYEEVPKDKIADPWAVAANYGKLVAIAEPTPHTEDPGDGGDNSSSGNTDGNTGSEGGDTQEPDKKPDEKPDDPPKEPEKKEVEVKLSSSSLTLEVGKSETLNVSDNDGNSYSVEWSSDDSSVASVSGGTVEAKAAGRTTIRAKVKGTDSVTIKNPELSCSVEVKAKETPKKEIEVKLNKTSLTLEVGKSETLNVSGSDGNSYSAKWSSSNSDVASVSGGTVTAKATGKATINVSVEGSADVTIKNPSLSCLVEVTAVKSEVEVKLNKTELNLNVGKKETLQIVDANGKTYSGEWKSENESIAQVFQDGQVKAIKDGTTTVKVKVKAPDGVTIKNPDLSCKVIVGNKNYTKVTISGKSEVSVGKTLTLTAKSEPEGAEIVWSSDDEKKAKVDSKGVVTGVAEGKVKIRATCKNNSSISDSMEITVKKAEIDPAAKLKDKDGNQLYYKKKSTGEYVEATYQDYKERSTFYKKVKVASEYLYTGWQTIDGAVYFFGKDNKYVTGDQVIQGAKYSFGSDGKLSKGNGSMGIDVSKWNGSIDWAAVKNSGVSYVIIRCGYRGSSTGALVEDPKFKSNIKGAKAAGLKVGAYFFSQAVNEVEAVEEASMAIDLVKGYGLDYPLFLDVEGSGGRGDAISRDTRTAVCKTFCQTVQNSGISSGVYANKTWFTEKINTGSLTGYKIWLAQYASAPTYTTTRYDMWQYSSKGKVSGISGSVDMNISYMN